MSPRISEKKARSHMIITILVIVLSVVADQVSKHFLAAFLTGLENRSYRLIPDVLHLTYLENRGAAFGMLSEHRWVFMVFSVIGIAGLIVISLMDKKRYNSKSKNTVSGG